MRLLPTSATEDFFFVAHDSWFDDGNCEMCVFLISGTTPALSVSPAADADKVTASSTNRVITVAIPKKAEAMPKKIAVTPKA